jgi:hypothetical protein
LAGGRLSVISTTESAMRRLTGEPFSDNIIDLSPCFCAAV